MDYRKTLAYGIILFSLIFLFIEEIAYDAGYQWGIFYELAMAIGASALICWILILRLKKDIRFDSWTLGFIVLFIAGGIIGSFSAIEGAISWADFFVWLGGIAVFFVLSQISDFKLIKRAAWFFVAFGFGLSAYGLTLFLVWKDSTIFSRAAYPLLNPDILAGYLLGLWWIAAALYFGGDHGKKTKWFLFLTIISIGILFILTVSATAFAAFVPAAGFFIYFFKDKIFNKKALLSIVLAAILILAGAVAFRYAFGLPIKESVSIGVTKANVSISGANRIQYFESGAKVFLSHIFTGVGFRNYIYYYYKNPADINELPNSTHWNYLDIAMSVGLLGLIGFLGFIIRTFLKNFKEVRKGKDVYYLAFFLAWVAVTINGAIEYNWEMKALVLNFLIFAGLMEGAWLSLNHQDSRQIKNADERLWVYAATALLALALFLKAGLVFAGQNYRILAEGRASAGKYQEAINYYEKAWMFEKSSPILLGMTDAQYAMAQQVNGQKQWIAAEDSAKEAIGQWPEYFSGYERLGNIYESEGKLKEAAEQYDQAIELNPKLEIMLHVERDRVYFELGDWQKVIDDTKDYLKLYEGQDRAQYFAMSQSQILQKNVDLVPLRLSMLLYYQAEAYLKLGNKEGAVESLKEILGYNPDFSDVRDKLSKIENSSAQ